MDKFKFEGEVNGVSYSDAESYRKAIKDALDASSSNFSCSCKFEKNDYKQPEQIQNKKLEPWSADLNKMDDVDYVTKCNEFFKDESNIKSVVDEVAALNEDEYDDWLVACDRVCEVLANQKAHNSVAMDKLSARRDEIDAQITKLNNQMDDVVDKHIYLTKSEQMIDNEIEFYTKLFNGVCEARAENEADVKLNDSCGCAESDCKNCDDCDCDKSDDITNGIHRLIKALFS